MERPAPLELSRENGQEMKAKRKGEGGVQKHQILEGFGGQRKQLDNWHKHLSILLIYLRFAIILSLL